MVCVQILSLRQRPGAGAAGGGGGGDSAGSHCRGGCLLFVAPIVSAGLLTIVPTPADYNYGSPEFKVFFPVIKN